MDEVSISRTLLEDLIDCTLDFAEHLECSEDIERSTLVDIGKSRYIIRLINHEIERQPQTKLAELVNGTKNILESADY